MKLSKGLSLQLHGNRKLSIVLEKAPKAQMRARATALNGKARVFKAKSQRINETDIKWLLKKYYLQTPMIGALKAILYCYMPIPKGTSKKNIKLADKGELYHIKKPDIDNLEKNIYDCMTSMKFYKDDAQICISNTVKKYSSNPRWEIIIEETELKYL